jgi:hypothetical protein
MNELQGEKSISKSKLWFGRFFILFFLLSLLELVLRFIGFQPGFVGGNIGEYLDFKPVDSLIVYKYFYTDTDAIYKANFEQSELFNYDSEIEINAAGFRSRAFDVSSNGNEKVLLIGDSFCWGGKARPISQSFADLLESDGFLVYNTGIPGAGPPQYLKLAQKYIPTLKPAQVVVAFYMANDIMMRDIKLYPLANRYHQTNAGWMDPYIDGDHISDPKDCYDYFVKRYSIPADLDAFNSICAKTVLTSQLWKIMKIFNWVKHPVHPDVTTRQLNNPFPYTQQPNAYKYLKAIQDICATESIPFHLCIIPIHSALNNTENQLNQELFGDIKYHWPNTLTRTDYNEWPDGHFNNSGHQKYAAFIADILRNQKHSEN